MNDPTPEPVVDPSLRALDWPRLVEALVERAATALGRERCAAPTLSTHRGALRVTLRQVSQLVAVGRETRIPFGGVGDVRTHLTRCARGELLDGRELIEVADTLAGVATLKRFLDERREELDSVRPLAAQLIPLPELQSRLHASFDRQGELSQVTYPHLAELRGRKARLHAGIREQLEELTEGDAWQGALQEDYLTQRNDRYVVPVKVQARSLDLGIVHDTSGSGQTIYVEPREVVGLNNRLKMADAELRREERAILVSLCEAVAAHGPDIREDLDAIGALDALAARARLAEDLDASEPVIEAGEVLELRDVRHPLLALRGVDVVANEVRLQGDQRALLLSGPNAGGKTVTLKTIGLCALMVRAGMHLPAAPGSRIGLFRHVLADIGDQQSVEADLSTFSAHVIALRRVLETLRDDGRGALVLVDEIAVGTDPQQGAALATAVLQTALDRGAVVAATTHFAALKALAEVDERFVNGRMEFDPEALRPTYRLSLGHPGRSYALDIARQLGLDEAVLTRAQERLDPSQRELEALLTSLEREREQVRRRAAELDRQRAALDDARGALDQRREALERQRATIREELIEGFDREVDGYREVVRGIIRDLQRAPSLAGAERGRKRIAGKARELRSSLSRAVGATADDEPDRVDWERARVGDTVRLRTGDREAELLGLPDARGRLEVRVGGARIRCRAHDLAPAGVGTRRKGSSPPRIAFDGRGGVRPSVTLDEAVRTPDNTLDLRGERVEEALERVDRFLDDAALGSDDVVFVLHGHGTGALRDAVRKHLADSPYVQAFAVATRSQGGDAVTAVRV